MGILTTALFLELTAWGQLLSFTPLYLRQELGVAPEAVPFWTGVLASSSLLVAFPLSPFWGVLADRYSRKAIILRSQLVAAVAYTAIALSSDVWQMLGARLLLGLSFGNVAIMIATQSLVTPERRLGTAISTIQMALPMALSIGPLVGSVLINVVGLRGMFATNAVFTLSAALIVLLAVREPPKRDTTTSLLERLKVALGTVAMVPPVRWNFVCWLLTFAAASVSDPYMPLVISRLSVDQDPAIMIGLIMGLQGLVMSVATPLAGRFADRIGSARLFLGALVLAIVVALGISVAPNLGVLAGLTILRALPLAAIAPALYTHLASRTPPQQRAAVLALTPMPRNLAMLIGPTAGAAATSVGLAAAFWLTAVVYAVALPFGRVLSRPHKPPEATQEEPARH
jgi:DHA1 family multidrug resistance protein-like MFS transporter